MNPSLLQLFERHVRCRLGESYLAQKSWTLLLYLFVGSRSALLRSSSAVAPPLPIARAVPGHEQRETSPSPLEEEMVLILASCLFGLLES